MVNRKFCLRMLVILLAFGMTVVGCDNGTTSYDPTGTWDFTMFEDHATVVITGNRWSIFFYGEEGDTGTFAQNGNSAVLRSNSHGGAIIGTATLTSNTTMILVLQAPSGIIGTFNGTKRNNSYNPFDGTSWTMNSDGSKLNFYSSTWEWFEHEMYSVNDEIIQYTFKGNYTFSGDVATMLSTHYRLSGSNWKSFSGKWTATLIGANRINVRYDGAVNSMMFLMEKNSERIGSRSLK